MFRGRLSRSCSTLSTRQYPRQVAVRLRPQESRRFTPRSVFAARRQHFRHSTQQQRRCHLQGLAHQMAESESASASDKASTASSGWSDEEGDEYLAKALASDEYLQGLGAQQRMKVLLHKHQAIVVCRLRSPFSILFADTHVFAGPLVSLLHLTGGRDVLRGLG